MSIITEIMMKQIIVSFFTSLVTDIWSPTQTYLLTYLLTILNESHKEWRLPCSHSTKLI